MVHKMSGSGVKRRFHLGMAAAMMAGTGLVTSAAAENAEPSAMERMQEKASNVWGDWGPDDEIGALNYLGGEEVLRAVQEVTSGKTFTLQLPMTHNFGPVFPGRIPTQHYMAQDQAAYTAGKKDTLPGGMKFSDDVAFIYLQGTTHVDALGHAWYGEEIYGGESALSTVHGHAHADVAALGERGIVGRGVLLDVGAHQGEDNGRLPPEACVTLDDLQATAEAQGVTIEPRDILLIRTGSIPRYFDEEPDAEWEAMTEPGLCYSEDLVEWFAEMEIPFLGADNLGVEKVVQEIDGETVIIPLHGALMRDLGVVISEIYWLEDLAADSAEDGRYSFMFVAAPLKMEQGTGSPVNPVAIK